MADDKKRYRAVLEEVQRWLSYDELSGELKKELLPLYEQGLSGSEDALEEIYERFYKDLEFGTGGLRGVLGAGTNRMNTYTIRRATQGLADYFNSRRKGGKQPSVAIAYDSRINSDVFAVQAAGVLAANGINVYLYKELMPTPALSFAVRYHNCQGGIMITASHNPAKYNGYKVYNAYGCQMGLDESREVTDCISKVDIFKDVKYTVPGRSPVQAATGCGGGNSGGGSLPGCVEYISDKGAEAYYKAVLEQSAEISCENLSVVYTPLNGTGNLPVRRIMREINVGRVDVVRQQELPDGNFPTCPFPNPEKEEALKLGLELCRELSSQGKGPDILLATDPDCDRVGIAVKSQEAGADDSFVLMSGNQVGVLLLDFICQRRGERMGQNPIAVKTIVTTSMTDAVAKDYGVELRNVLTGFKFIGEQINELEDAGQDKRYIFGFEESYGYLAGSYVRDKDAVNAAMLICQMASYYKEKGITLLHRMNELYEKYGYYQNDLVEFTFEGARGMEEMQSIINSLRSRPPVEVTGKKVVEFADYLTSQRKITGRGCDMAAGTLPVKLPKSDVLEFVLEDGSSFIIRPSGTEPKLKVYLSAKGSDPEASNQIIDDLREEIEKKFIN